MKTEALINLLARSSAGTGELAQPAARAQLVAALGWGAFGATLFMALVLGVRPDIGDAIRDPMFWVKLFFPLSLIAPSLVLAGRLARPGVTAGRWPGLLIVPVAVIWLLAVVALSGADAESRAALIFGGSWQACLVNVTWLSLPMLVASFLALRQLAPTRLALAGGVAGLLAGAVGAAAYALYCPEMAAPFLALWYLGGMLIPAVVGALAAPWLLRW